MKFQQQLNKACAKNNSLLCVGLDIDLSKIPQTLASQEDPIYLFNKQIINETKDYVCAYKPNLAFYERYGNYGLSSLIKTIDLIQSLDLPVILDAKRGDIGHSSAAYAEAIFNVFKADATTVSPYMGFDSLEPFLEYQDKGIFVLCLTSNPGAADFEKELFLKVAQKVKEWDKNKNCGLVVGATNPNELLRVREIVPDMPILLPGVGAQKGDLKATVELGVDAQGNNAIVNSSRGIIYAESPGEAAKQLRDEINQYRYA
ncbi:MAG: orotidine-5'-phosphate decarboxylase [bacterium]